MHKKINNYVIHDKHSPFTGNMRVGDNELMISDEKSGRSVWAIKYPSTGKIAYDYPEWLPKYIKEEVKKVFKRNN